jgi:Formaldehyde-activating enzyme (Fae)
MSTAAAHRVTATTRAASQHRAKACQARPSQGPQTFGSRRGDKFLRPFSATNDLFVTVGVFIHWEAKDDKKIQDFNYRATKEAIARAIKGEPKASEVTAKKESAHHPFAAS